jgi:hypothetical protein
MGLSLSVSLTARIRKQRLGSWQNLWDAIAKVRQLLFGHSRAFLLTSAASLSPNRRNGPLTRVSISGGHELGRSSWTESKECTSMYLFAVASGIAEYLPLSPVALFGFARASPTCR